MNSNADTLDGNSSTVADLAISHPGALDVFTKYNIDYCCGGNRSLADACEGLGLNPDEIRREILSISATNPSLPSRAEQWSSGFLAEYIIENHHNYVKNAIPEIQGLLDKICGAHGEDSIELFSVRDDFSDLAEELIDHMNKEELVVFPAIGSFKTKASIDDPLVEPIQSCIEEMEHDHQHAGDLIKSLRILTKNYTPPEYACPTWRISYQKLRAFDTDLMMHIYLENNILFKRVKLV